MEETNKTEETQEETSKELNIVEKAEEVNSKLDEKIKRYEELKTELDEARAKDILSGKSDAGDVEVIIEKEVSDKDYAIEVLEGRHNGKEKGN